MPEPGNPIDPSHPATRARLTRGEVVVVSEVIPGAKQPRITAAAVIEAPCDAVWAWIDRGDRYDQFMPRVKVAQELSRDAAPDGGEIIRQKTVVDMPFPLRNMTTITRVHQTVDAGVRYERRWTLESGDVRSNDGRWLLTPFDGDGAHTLASYQVLVVPKIPMPKKVQAGAQQRALPKMFDALRRVVRS